MGDLIRGRVSTLRAASGSPSITQFGATAMPIALFGIDNDALNLTVNLLVLVLVVVWLALVAWTFFDARRRLNDEILVGCAVGASLLFPFIGSVIYSILRPPEFIEDRHERELEIRAAELRVKQLTEKSCPKCEYPLEKGFLRCPNCQARVKDPCPSCGEPIDPRWSICPYCETPTRREPPKRRAPERRPARERGRGRPSRAPERERPAPAQASAPAKQRPAPKRDKAAPAEPQRPKAGSAESERRKAPARAGRRAGGGREAKQGSDDGPEGRASGGGAGEERPRPATAS